MGEALDLKDLDALANTPLTLMVGGVVREVTPIRAGELPAMLRACEPIFGLLAGADMMAALLHDAESVLAAIAIGARLPRAEIDALELDDLLKLGGAVLQVNADFFVRRLAPAFIAISAKVATVLAGSMPSPALSAQDSAAPTK